MCTFDQWLLTLLKEGRVTVESAMKAVSNKHDFELAMQQAGLSLSV
jgi:Tfp pilus assembly ATPase PilU